jgi:hypothetical protein
VGPHRRRNGILSAGGECALRHPHGDVLHHWVTGKEVVITYQTVEGASRSSSFTLVGMRNALLTVTGAKVED